MMPADCMPFADRNGLFPFGGSSFFDCAKYNVPNGARFGSAASSAGEIDCFNGPLMFFGRSNGY